MAAITPPIREDAQHSSPGVADADEATAGQRVDAAILEYSAFTLPVPGSDAELARALVRIRTGDDQPPVIWAARTGVLGFLSSVFRGCRPADLYGQVFLREPQGRGAHFDVYDDILHADYPWVALLNLAGDAVVTVCRLPEPLARRYEQEYPHPTDAAYAERRRISAGAIGAPDAHLEKGLLSQGSVLVIPQQMAGPDWVHHVVPLREDNPGRFVKFAVAAAGNQHLLEDRGYRPINDLLWQALLNAPVEGTGDSEIRPTHRRCNLD